MAKQVLFNREAKEALKKGVNIVSDAVGSTLGAKGRTVAINHHKLHYPNITKDGATVCNSIVLNDEIENMGALLIREAATKTMKKAGDGTTSTTVIAQSMINNGIDSALRGHNPQEIKRGIEKSVDAICSKLKEMSYPVGDSNDKIKNIATISANNDIEIGTLIADAYKKIGNEGMLLIEESGTLETIIDVVDGAEIARGFISPEFANNKEKVTYCAEDAYILVTDYTLTSVIKDLAPLFQQMERAGIITKPILIVAQDYEGEVFGTILQNVRKGTLNCCLSQVPSQYRVETMEDIAILTGATLISDREGIKMENALIEHLGRAKSIIVSEHTTTIAGGHGDPKKVAEHKTAVKVQMDEMKDEQLKEVWKTRLGRISGSIGVIKIGGATDLEVKEKKDRIEDSVRAVESAIEEGVVVGGGVALLRCLDSLKSLNLTQGEDVGRDIVKKACEAPLKKMLENAGLEKTDKSIVGLINRFWGFSNPIFNKVASGYQNFGYNIKADKYCNLFEEGIIDPTKVVRCSIQNAASVACGIITTDCIIVERE